ncbi:hypothetical protein QJQ45_025334 [Haematococcus lacustris]|nr:hypothetical protein QJQ45_025334 [Haematococcus lacustris]
MQQTLPKSVHFVASTCMKITNPMMGTPDSESDSDSEFQPVKAMGNKKRGVKALRASLQIARDVKAQLRAAMVEAHAPAGVGAAEAEAQAEAEADAGAYEAQLHQLQADLKLREEQLADNKRLQQLQQQLHDLQRGELQRKEQQLADLVALQEEQHQQQQQQLQQLQQQLTEKQQQLEQQQADMRRREQEHTELQHQLQQQQAQLSQREQDLTERQHQLQQQQANLHLKEQQLTEQRLLIEQQARTQTLQQRLHRLQQEVKAQKVAEVQREVQQQSAQQQHLLQQQQADLLPKQQQVKEHNLAHPRVVSTNHPLPDPPPCSHASLASPIQRAAPTALLTANNRFATLRVADEPEQQPPSQPAKLDEHQAAAAAIAAAAVATVLRAAARAEAAGAAGSVARARANAGAMGRDKAMRRTRGNPTPAIPHPPCPAQALSPRPVWDLRTHRQQQQQQQQPLSPSPQTWQRRLQPMLEEFQRYTVEEGAELLDRLQQHRRMRSVVSLATGVVAPTPDQELGGIMVESLRPVLAGIKPAPGGQRSTNQQPFNTALIMTMGRGIEQHGIKRTAKQLGITPDAVKRARRSHLSNLAAGATADWAAAPLRRGRRCLSQAQLEYVRTFFEEHSSPSPMYKDVRRYYVRMTAGSSKKSEVRMSRRYVDRSLKKLYLEYEQECPANLKVGSTTFEVLRPPWVKRITAAHKQVCVCIPCETCELLLDQLGKHMDSLVLPEDPQPLDDSDSDSGSDSGGGEGEVHVLLAEHIANADAQDLAGVLDAGVLDEVGLEKLVSDAQNARAAAGAAGGGAAAAGCTVGSAAVRVDLDYATVQSWFVCPCKVGAKPSLACLQRQCAACKDRKVGVKVGCEGVQLQYRQFNKLDNGQGIELATVQTTLGELVTGLNALMQKQLWHQYLAKHQRATFRAHCAAVQNTPGLVVVSCDWSEKLTIHQDIACQGAYWKQRTMSVFVACAHYQDTAGNYREESVFVSADKCDQSAEASTTALVQVIECLLQGRRHPDDGWVGKMDMRQLCLWSDGCASQFKGAKAIKLHWHLANSTCMSVPCLPCMKPDTTTPLEPMPMFQDTVKEVRDDEECYALLILFHSDLLHDEVCFGKLTNKHCERYRMHMGWKRQEGRRALRRWVRRELLSEQLEAEYEADN